MHCANCASEMNGPVCAVCGTAVSGAATNDTLTGLALAGWWRRVGATFADNLILVLPSYVVLDFFTVVSGAYLGFAALLALQGFYMVRLIASSRGQTIGNRVAATRVRDAQTGQRATTRQSFKRWAFIALYQLILVLVGGTLALPLLFLASAIDGLYPLFNARKQTFHDRFAGTIVVLAPMDGA